MLFVAGAAILFASKGLFSKALYQRGVGFELLVTVRALLAMPLFVWFARAVRSGQCGGLPRGRRPAAVFAAAIAGIVCYYVGALVDFWALDAHRRLHRTRAAVQLPGAGGADQFDHAAARAAARLVFACCSPTPASSSPWVASTSPSCAQNLFGASLVLIAALTTAIYFLIGERYMQELGSTRFAAIAMSSSAVALAIHFALFRSVAELAPLAAHDWMLLGILAIACMFLPGLMQAEGVRSVGAQRAAIGSTVGPPTTIVLAALFLGERLNGWQLLGSAHDRGQRAGAQSRQERPSRPRISYSARFASGTRPRTGR